MVPGYPGNIGTGELLQFSSLNRKLKSYILGGQYPGGYVPGVGVPTVNGIGTNVAQYPGAGSQGIIGGGGNGVVGYPGGPQYYPGQNIGQYPNGVAYPGAGGTGTIGTAVGPANLVEAEDDSFSQSETAVKNGEATASAQGKRHGGNAQTQVSGSYSSGGTFSANAQTSDKDRSAQAQVTGNKDGALSSAQGTGGSAKSQSQVQVNEKSGATSATSQSGGSSHESQSEVQANEKGGLADAQSSGPGQTSSQAQIGFRPVSDANSSKPGSIFNGGGQASAQSTGKSGQSQSQISGKFQ